MHSCVTQFVSFIHFITVSCIYNDVSFQQQFIVCSNFCDGNASNVIHFNHFNVIFFFFVLFIFYEFFAHFSSTPNYFCFHFNLFIILLNGSSSFPHISTRSYGEEYSSVQVFERKKKKKKKKRSIFATLFLNAIDGSSQPSSSSL